MWKRRDIKIKSVLLQLPKIRMSKNFLPHSEPVCSRILIVTGMSGAGKSTALKALEDMGFEAVDNLPLSLLIDVVRSRTAMNKQLAIGVDIRTRDFGISAISAKIDQLVSASGKRVSLIFFDCDDEVLQRRYSETRRKHPLATDRRVIDGILHERVLVSALRDRAEFVIDTTHLSSHELRRALNERFSLLGYQKFVITVISFAYRRGVPRDADLVFDVRFLENPFYNQLLRPLTGLDPQIGEFIQKDVSFMTFFENLKLLLEPLLPRYQRESRSYLTIAIGCTGGRHRSVFVAEQLSKWLKQNGNTANQQHRELTHAN